MKVTPLAIPDILLLEPRVFNDARGFFMECFNEKQFQQVTELHTHFVQDNYSHSEQGVLRGLHYQRASKAQGKLVRVLQGVIFDVVVDLRRDSKTFGKWLSTELNAKSHSQLWIPPGFAHGFLVLSDSADVLYKTTDYYAPAFEVSLDWNDPDLDIHWPKIDQPYLSSMKDANGMTWATICKNADLSFALF